jgi:CheY-like chemotaxis protein
MAVAAKNSNKLILVGEDDVDDQDFLRETFSSIDDSVSVEFAWNGPQVLKYLGDCEDDHLPCLIILDYNMPEMTGAEILKELKSSARYKNVPKIIWSTSGSKTYMDVCLESGANDYVIKPSNVQDLIKVSRYMLSFCK